VIKCTLQGAVLRPLNSGVRPLDMRFAKIISWVVGLLWLLLAVISALKYTGTSAAASFAFVVPFATAIGAFHYLGLSWLRWIAIVANALWSLLGLIILSLTILGMLGVNYFSSGSPMLVAPFVFVVMLGPGILNVVALWKGRKAESVSPRSNNSLQRP
jgi:hypothetical protein